MGYSGKAKPGFEKPPASMVMTRIGGHDYPLHTEANCRTCQSPHRIWIESALLQGRTYMGISKELEKREDAGPLGHPNRDNIADHYRNGHMPLPDSIKRRLIERRAQQIGAKMEEASEQLIDKLTVAQMIMTEGYEQLIEGTISPTVAETLAAARLVNEIELQAGKGIDEEAWMAAMMAFLDDARKEMDEAQWTRFTRKLTNNPVLKAMAAKQQQAREIEGQVL